MSHVGASFWENYVLIKFVVLLMFILNNSSAGCWCVDPMVGLQPAHMSRGVINGSRRLQL